MILVSVSTNAEARLVPIFYNCVFSLKIGQKTNKGRKGRKGAQSRYLALVYICVSSIYVCINYLFTHT